MGSKLSGIFEKFLLGLNLLSLDAPMVAFLWYAVLAHQFDQRVEPILAWLLCSTTWTVYALDRLFEPSIQLSKPRHHFHKKYRIPFVIIILMVLTVNCLTIVVHHFPPTLYKGGIILGAACGAYVLQPQLPIPDRFREWIKNTLVAFVFSIAVALPVWVRTVSIGDDRITNQDPLILSVVTLFLLALANLRSIEFIENNPPQTLRPVTPWVCMLLIFAITMLHPSPTLFAWFTSALLTAILAQWIHPNRCPTGLFDFALWFPLLVFWFATAMLL